ncbi:MAG: NnrS family protein [Sulfurovum sp.]|nr:NnrS family protein [Sulfurovum sp.]MCB4761981.1 NnrS family protein [Sulfurovum sp.]MCB4763903.1 NnrS family protein [Sulfurovum sp.]MCB4766489.1 NnrS family protein [Sulfurovum sp.]MCB4773300.1 NnrS family protein [Sulfurovum sp.]
MAATKHYESYPEGDIPIYLAYGFRPTFLLMAPYMVLSILLWALYYSGYITLPFIGDTISWHIYEMLFGVGFLGMAAFIFTGAPELFPGTVPVVGSRLRNLMLFWIIGRIAFWFMDSLTPYPAMFINVTLYIWLTLLVIKPIFKDPAQRHVSIAYGFVAVQIAQIWFYLSVLGLVSTAPLEILKISIGIFLVLILLSIRRVNMEAVNEIIELEEKNEEIFVARPPAYNLVMFMIALFTAVEFFFPGNKALGWIGLGVAAASLAILNDFIAYDEENILGKRLIRALIAVPILIAIGYGLIGYNYLAGLQYNNNDFLHVLTSGAWTLSFYLVMVVITIVHTGRDISKERKNWICFSVAFILLATLLRASVTVYPVYSSILYMSSAVIWSLPFIIYIKQCFPWLLLPRVDNLPG